MPDERFKLHQLKSTRLSAIVTAVAAGVWVEYQLIFQKRILWDLIVILGIMALTKIIAMFYFKRTN